MCARGPHDPKCRSVNRPLPRVHDTAAKQPRIASRRRRALVRDKAVSYAHQVEDYADKTARDLSNRATGLAHEARKAVGMT